MAQGKSIYVYMDWQSIATKCGISRSEQEDVAGAFRV